MVIFEYLREVFSLSATAIPKKKEISKKEKERKKLAKLDIFREHSIIDIRREKIAFTDLKKKKIPVLPFVDTNDTRIHYWTV